MFKRMGLFRPKKAGKIKAIDLNGLRRNWDFEVISKVIFDDEGNEYLSEDHVPKEVSFRLAIREDDIPECTDVAFRFEMNEEAEIHIVNAKQCGFGVLRMLRGNLAGRQYMFPIDDFHHGLQLFAYGVLTHDYMDKDIANHLLSDINEREMLKICVGMEIYDLVMHKVRTHNLKWRMK
ncbi:hypothetical protein [Brevibacillus choshinensis]|uniref:Uncharacterized protein n=1 Tax=Brevibacillus choshinensis TaxID=54911 RepID=A0ABX7FJD4_BRECH|nr:hypothetical protein [Brevibacillus choshinensis]QRG65970.1 hypothetical protein JNE38_20650 [Brevibacillus choshinensis]